MPEMTSKERVLTAIGHQEPDRVPLFSFSVDPKFIKILGGGDPFRAFEALHLDTFPIRAQCWCEGVPLASALVREVAEDDQTAGGVFGGWNGVDEFGRIWKRGSYVGGALKGPGDVDRFIPPLRLEERTPSEAVRTLRDRFPHKAWSLNIHCGPFGLTMESMGFEGFFYALYDDRDLVKEVIHRRTDWFIEVSRHAERLGADFVVMGDDVAYKGKTFVSPADFEELAIPHYRRIVEALSIPLLWHSDGFIEPLIDLAVAAGIRGLHALEPPAGNDLGRIKARYGDRLVLLGNVDCVEVLTGTDLDRVRSEVDRCMAQAKAGGGFMLAESNSLHGACTVEAVKEMYDYGMWAGGYSKRP
jgi:uroporphyrinogen decarboxylase